MADEPLPPPTTPEDDSRTARERRAQRVKEQGRKEAPMKALKYTALAVAIVLVIAGGVWAIRQIEVEGPPGHEHSVFRMFADGQEINFNHPLFDLDTTRFLDAHLHFQGPESTTSQFVIHVEGTRRVNLDVFFDTLRVDVSKNRVRLNTEVHGGVEYRNNATHTWQLWVDGCEDGTGNFHKQGKMFDYKPRHHDRMLFTFAPSSITAESLQEQFATIPDHAALDRDLRETCRV